MIKTETTLEAAIGGALITITFNDGKTDSITVANLRPKDAQLYLQLSQANDEEGLVELVCRKEKGWAVSLTRESFEDVLAVDAKINQDFMMRCAQRAIARREKLMPGQQEKIIQAAVSSLVERLAPSLQTLLPKPESASPTPANSPSNKSGS